jgi:hypothetical protein
MLRHPTSPTGAGSKICLEVMPIDSVTLSDGRGLEERTPTRLYLVSVPHWLRRPVHIWSFCIAGVHLGGDPVQWPSLVSSAKPPPSSATNLMAFRERSRSGTHQPMPCPWIQMS